MFKKAKNRLVKKMRQGVWFSNRRFITDNLEYINGDVIDVGAQDAKYKGILESAPGFKSYTGLDFYRTQASTIVADLNKPLPISDEQYDSAICISVIEHLLEPQLALNEVARILKPSGYLLLAAPWIYPFHGEPYDYHRYSKEALEYLFKKAGFEVISVASTGGKMRIVSVFIMRWIPGVRRFNFFIEWLSSKFSSKEMNEKNPIPNTPSHRIIGRKI